MEQGLISPDWEPLRRLLETILVRIRADLADALPVGLSVSTASPAGVLRLITLGEGAGLVEAQAELLDGPLPEAIATGLPIAVADLWAEPRWPRLTREALNQLLPELASTWARIHGMAVLPVGHVLHSSIVLSCCLAKPADDDVLEVLARYQPLLEAAFALTQATATDGPENVLRILTGRAVIEQAKGAIVAVTGAGSSEAWRTLRETSQHHNVKLRDLALALIEYLGREPAEVTLGLPLPDRPPRADAVARMLWQQLMTHPLRTRPTTTPRTPSAPGRRQHSAPSPSTPLTGARHPSDHAK